MATTVRNPGQGEPLKLPNGHRAIVDINKLRDYCLCTEHPEGKHKAWVFAAALGLERSSADELRAMLLSAALHCDAVPTGRDDYGQRYVLDFTVTGPRGHAAVRSVWIVLSNEDCPRLVSCYVPRRMKP